MGKRDITGEKRKNIERKKNILKLMDKSISAYNKIQWHKKFDINPNVLKCAQIINKTLLIN